jgi:hypothetical protein
MFSLKVIFIQMCRYAVLVTHQPYIYTFNIIRYAGTRICFELQNSVEISQYLCFHNVVFSDIPLNFSVMVSQNTSLRIGPTP